MEYYKLYRKMSLEEFNRVKERGFFIDDKNSFVLCPKKCFSESLISTYRLNPRRSSLSQVIAEYSFPLSLRNRLIESGIQLPKVLFSDNTYESYLPYSGKNLYYKCHGNQIDLMHHEVDGINLGSLNECIIEASLINKNDYANVIVHSHLGSTDIENLLTSKLVSEEEYYIQLPFDLAVLLLKYKQIPNGGLNKFVKERFISKDIEALEQMNRGIFPVTIAIRVSKDFKHIIDKNINPQTGCYSIKPDLIFRINRHLNDVRLVNYEEERSRYKYASDKLNYKINVSDVLNGTICDNSSYYGENQIALTEVIDMIEANPNKEFLLRILSNINDGLYLDSDYHGKSHAERVCFLSFVISAYMNLPEEFIKVLIQASLLHDTGRMSDIDDSNHGLIGAERINSMELLEDDFKSRKLTQFLIEAHEINFEKDQLSLINVMKKYDIENNIENLTLLRILMDADALDRTRFNVFGETKSGLDENYLRLPISKELVDLSKVISKAYYDNSSMTLNRVL